MLAPTVMNFVLVFLFGIAAGFGLAIGQRILK